MKVYGLVGHPLSHSFSERYFSEKFDRLKIKDSSYKLFDLKNIGQIKELKSVQNNLKGFNVTIPYKEKIIPYLDGLHKSAQQVGAVNVVSCTDDNLWIGYNSDYYGFMQSLKGWLTDINVRALVLGTGGASKAIGAVLKELDIEYKSVSRKKNKGDFTYKYLLANKHLIKEYLLIVNTTPLGMSPNIDVFPEIDYTMLTSQHFLYDLVYNPEETEFLKRGKNQNSQVKNGLEMLELQAEKSWQIWNPID